MSRANLYRKLQDWERVEATMLGYSVVHYVGDWTGRTTYRALCGVPGLEVFGPDSSSGEVCPYCKRLNGGSKG